MTTARGRVLVTGATGALGPQVVATLLRHGWRVRALSRRTPPAGVLPDDVHLVSGDVTDPDVVHTAVTSMDAVVHLAALLHIVNPDPALRREYERVNIEGTRVVAQAARAAGVSRLVVMSTIAVYGYQAHEGTLIDESTSPAPDTDYARTKLEAERVGVDVGPPGVTVLRPAAVYGARVKGNYARLVEALARGRYVPIGDRRNRRTLVHEADLAQAVATVLAAPDPLPGVFNVTDGCVHTVREIEAAMCAALGRTSPGRGWPRGPVRLAMRALDASAGLVGRRSTMTASLDKYCEDVAVDGRRFSHSTGFTAGIDLRRGWAMAVDQRQGGAV